MSARILPGLVLFFALGLPTGLAAQTSTTPPAQQPPGVNATQPAVPSAAAAPYRGLEGMPIHGQNGEKIGEVEDVLIDQAGRVVALAVEIDRVLGIGDYDIVVTLEHFRHVDGRLYTALTREQLEAMPKWRQ